MLLEVDLLEEDNKEKWEKPEQRYKLEAMALLKQKMRSRMSLYGYSASKQPQKTCLT